MLAAPHLWVFTVQAANNDSTARCAAPEGFHVFQAVIEHILFIFSLVAVIFNCTVVVCAVKMLRRSGDTMHVFVVTMAVGDILVTAFAHPYVLAIRRRILPSEVPVCSASHFVELVGIAVSGLSLTLLNVDKFIYFRWPLKYLLMSKNRATLLSVASVGVCVIFAALMWILRVAFIANGGIDCRMTV